MDKEYNPPQLNLGVYAQEELMNVFAEAISGYSHKEIIDRAQVIANIATRIREFPRKLVKAISLEEQLRDSLDFFPSGVLRHAVLN